MGNKTNREGSTFQGPVLTVVNRVDNRTMTKGHPMLPGPNGSGFHVPVSQASVFPGPEMSPELAWCLTGPRKEALWFQVPRFFVPRPCWFQY